MIPNRLSFIEADSREARAEVLKAFIQELASDDEVGQALLVIGMKGAGMLKVEGVGENLKAKESLQATEDALVMMMRDSDPKKKMLGMKLAAQFYDGERSAKMAAVEESPLDF